MVVFLLAMLAGLCDALFTTSLSSHSVGHRRQVLVRAPAHAQIDVSVPYDHIDISDPAATDLQVALLFNAPSRSGVNVTVVVAPGGQKRTSILELPPAIPEGCRCVAHDASLWRQHLGCLPFSYWQRATADWQRWSKITLEHLAAVERRTKHIIRYVVQKNQLYKQTYPQGIVGISQIVEAFLLVLLRQVAVPDVEFIINYSDYPVMRRGQGRELGLALSMSTTDDFHDILIPTYEQMRSSLFRRPCLPGKPWSARNDSVVWRGSDSSNGRFAFNKAANALEPARHYNIGISNMIRVSHNEMAHGPMRPRLGFCEFFDAKMVASVDGSVAAYRFPALLAGGSLILKQDSPFLEHFYDNLEPGVHLLTFSADNSNLSSTVEWALSHDTEAYRIAQTGRRFYFQALTPEQTLCFLANTLERYAERQAFVPEVRPNMKLVEQPFVRDDACSCYQRNNKAPLRDEL